MVGNKSLTIEQMFDKLLNSDLTPLISVNDLLHIEDLKNIGFIDHGDSDWVMSNPHPNIYISFNLDISCGPLGFNIETLNDSIDIYNGVSVDDAYTTITSYTKNFK